MMRQMRENTKWIMLLTAAAFVALMVFEWGMDLSGQSSAALTGGQLGSVNGEPIMYEEYSAVYRNLYEQQRQAQDEPISSAQNRQIEDAAWNQVVTDHLIRQELERRGIQVTADEIRQAARFAPPPELRSNEAFQTDGQFDLQKYQQFLANSAGNRDLMLQLEAYYRDVIPRNKLYQQVASGVYVSDQELWRMWRDQHETARVRFVTLDPQQLVADDEISVSDQEIQAYYNAHKEDFRRPARATLRVVTLSKAPVAADSAAALERAEALRQEILDGADFAEVAERESADPGSAGSGGDLGTIRRGQTVPAFEEAVWSLRIGRISEPVLSPFGYHLIKVTSRTDEEAEVQHILIPIERGNESELELLDRADSLEVLGETMMLDAAAEEMGLPVRTVEVNEEQPFVPGVGQLTEGADWAFGQAESGDVSPVFEAGSAYYMVELVERTPERILPLDEAEPAIRTRLLQQKKLEKARDVAGGLVDEIRGGTDLAAVAKANDLEVQETEEPFTRLDFVPGLGRANAAIGTAFGLQPGQVSDAVEANNRLYILEVLERQPADREAWEEQKEQQRARAIQVLQQQQIQQFIAGLRENAEIEDQRDLVLRPVDESEQPAGPTAPLGF